jgi:group I intron endonuclease
MGFIYELVFPSGKKYIGQTIYDTEKRWKEHIEDALNFKKDHCKCLNKAIRKYGVDKCIRNIILECNNETLDIHEEKFIKEMNTQTPFGYNIKSGGSSAKHHEETKQKISETLKGREISIETRQKISDSKKSSDLPMYLIKVKHGFRVCNHPKGPEKRFLDKKQSDEEKLERALKYLNNLNSLEEPVIVERSLPTYLRKHKNGFFVKKPCFKTKYFVSKTLDTEINYKLALEYLNSLDLKEKVQRLNGDGVCD